MPVRQRLPVLGFLGSEKESEYHELWQSAQAPVGEGEGAVRREGERGRRHRVQRSEGGREGEMREGG